MNNMNNNQTISDFYLEEFIAGELSPDETAAFAARVESDDELRKRVAALRESNVEIQKLYPPKEELKRILNLVDYARAAEAENGNRKSSRGTLGTLRTRWSLRTSYWAIPAVACAALVLTITLGDFHHAQKLQDTFAFDGRRTKGSVDNVYEPQAILQVWRRAGEQTQLLTCGDTAHEGDVVQLRYAVSEDSYGVIISVDGRGVLFEHLSDGKEAAQLAAGNFVTLSNAYKLDDAPRYEIFYFITSPEKFAVDDVKQYIDSANHPITNLSLPIAANITAFTLVKQSNVNF